jgi:hypothetical protein
MYVKGTPVYHSLDKSGRVFQTMGALRTFISNVMNNTYRNSDVTDWQVVEYEMQVRDIREVHEIIKPEKIVKLLKNS